MGAGAHPPRSAENRLIASESRLDALETPPQPGSRASRPSEPHPVGRGWCPSRG